MKHGLALLAVFAFVSSSHAQLTPISGVAQVSAGGVLLSGHTCIVTTAGAVQCWGNNDSGQLGDGTFLRRSTAVTVVGLESGIAEVAAGGRNACARRVSGEVMCWGGGVALPQSIGTGAQAITQGDGFVCVLTIGGGVKCRGNNFFGQLGDGTTTQSNVLVDVVGLGSGVTAVRAHNLHACAALAAGGVRCWGANFNGRLGDGTTTSRTSPVAVSGLPEIVTQLAAGDSHTCALTSGGAVKCWGSNSAGEIGDNTTLGRLTATAVSGLGAGVSSIGAGSSFSTASSADSFQSKGFSLAILGDGSVRAWGYGGGGQLGNGARIGSLVPQLVPGLTAAMISASGSGHACALLPDATLRCWGSNQTSQLGSGKVGGTIVPRLVGGAALAAQSIDNGSHHTCALLSGAVQCWGFNERGQLGDGTVSARTLPVPVTGLMAGVTKISVGGNHACAINASGAPACWGENGNGQLGNGAFGIGSSAVTVSAMPTAVEMAPGGAHTCALIPGGGVKCWGSDGNGQLGNGAAGSSPTPVDVTGLSSGVLAVASGAHHACAIKADGTVECWGENANRQLGDGTTTNRPSPVAVVGLPATASALTLGRFHSCGKLTTGAVACWGINSSGQLGQGDNSLRNTPVTIASLGTTTASKIVSGLEHSCALTVEGRLLCWGANSFGQLGDGTIQTRSVPTPVVEMDGGVTDVSAGYLHTCAVKSGQTYCWGDDGFGQLADGADEPGISSSPASVNFDATPRNVVATATPDAAASSPATDASGRFVAFQSRATNLGDDDGGLDVDIYRVDTACVGGFDGDGAPCERIVRASVDDAGAPFTGDAMLPSLTADGQLLLFVAEDSGVGKVRGESGKQGARRRKAGGFGVYMRNLIAGSTQRLGTNAAGNAAPRLSPSGNAVVFQRPNAAQDPGTPGQPNVYVMPIARSGGATTPGVAQCVSCKTFDASGAPTEQPSDGVSGDAVVSADGTWVAWETQAKNMLPTPSPCTSPASVELLLRNLITGAVQRVGSPTTAAACGSSGSSKPRLDYSGGKLVFESNNVLRVGATGTDVYYFDASSQTLDRVSDLANNSSSNGGSGQAALSGDGETVVFVSTATNLDSNEVDTNAAADLFAYSVRSRQLKRLARTAAGAETDNDSRRPALTYSGMSVVYDSDAGNLTADSVSGRDNVYQRANANSPDKIYYTGFE